MSGVGRRTPYRKALTDSVLYDRPEPGPDERIAKVVGTRGSNQFDVILARQASNKDSDSSGDNGRPSLLAILPTKFHKLVWVKRNNFVFVQTVSEDEQGEYVSKGGGIRFMITHVLYKDQVKHLKTRKLWPSDDPEFATGTETLENQVEQPDEDCDEAEPPSSDGIVYQEDEFDMMNPNQRSSRRRRDYSDDSSDDSEQDDG